MSTTLTDVARRAGVSIATASRVLNDSTYGVTSELRTRVLAAAAELHYVPNAHAQALARASTSTVGIIVHDVSDPYFAEITRGIQRVASAADRLVMICNTYGDLDRELAYARLLHTHRLEALILAGSGWDDRAFTQKLTTQLNGFRDAGGRVVLIGRHHVAGDAVIPDNVGGARSMTQALLELGHTRLGVITGPALLTTTRDRLTGIRSALQQAGLTLPPTHVIESDFSRDGGVKAATELISRAPEITAMVALNDTMAIGTLAALRAANITVPNQISVTGFDDIAMTRDTVPTLSTVHVPMVEMGARAMELALSSHESEWRVEYFPTTIVLRASTAHVSTSG